MKAHSAALLVASAVAAAAGTTTSAHAAYTFTPIADSTGPLSQPMNVAINDTGAVMVEWLMDSGSNSIDLYQAGGSRNIGFGGPQAQTPYSNVAYGSLNATGQVGFIAVPYSPSSVQIQRDTAAAKQTISQLPNVQNDSYGNGTSINDTGVLAFRQSVGGVSTIQRTNGTTSTTIAQAGQNNAAFLFDPTINNAGQVGYLVNLSGGGRAIRRGDGTNTVTIADTTGPISDIASVALAMNNVGQVAFAGERDAGGEALYVGDGSTLTPVVTTDGPYADFAWVSINDLGGIAFLAPLDAGGGGIFTGADPVADKVIAIGDSLFGGTVQSLQIFSDGLNAPGQVAFRYRLTNGTFGVAVATVPEPASLFGVTLLPAMALMRRRRRAL